MIKYRQDIDGLRALAILSVVLFHMFPSFLPGGFTGVDIFFIISGYLIGSTILNEYDNKRFIFSQQINPLLFLGQKVVFGNYSLELLFQDLKTLLTITIIN